MPSCLVVCHFLHHSYWHRWEIEREYISFPGDNVLYEPIGERCAEKNGDHQVSKQFEHDANVAISNMNVQHDHLGDSDLPGDRTSLSWVDSWGVFWVAGWARQGFLGAKWVQPLGRGRNQWGTCAMR